MADYTRLHAHPVLKEIKKRDKSRNDECDAWTLIRVLKYI